LRLIAGDLERAPLVQRGFFMSESLVGSTSVLSRGFAICWMPAAFLHAQAPVGPCIFRFADKGFPARMKPLGTSITV
jgi:hypothetical protein